jgi:hypothetical protein
MDLGMFTQSHPSRSNQHRPNNNTNRHTNKGKSPASGGGSAWKKDATCHYCGKRGHIKTDCYSFLRSQGKPTGSGHKPAGRANVNLAE